MPKPLKVNRTTGLPDRSACSEHLNELLVRSGSGHAVAVFWLDLDRFHAINRGLGHQAGDQVLNRIAARISTRVPQRLDLFHVGADEFVVLAPESDQNAAAELAAELLAVIKAPLELGTVLLHPSCSMGIALRESGESAADLLHRADRAKHDAKEQGRNRWVFAGEERVLGRHGALLEHQELQIEDDLHEALDNGGLQLHYQPIMLHDGRVEAVEALMRCTVKGRTTRPDQLIRVAEKTGLIGRLGEWSMVTAAEFARQLSDRGRATKVAVNVSAAQLLAPGFAEGLAGALLVSDLDARLLELEVTESLVLRLSTEVQSNFEACLKLGHPFAIDDFGTGESCLAKLKDLPATKLKLDRAFASVLPHDRRAYAVVRAMSQLGRELGMTVVAEGAETREQVESLWEAGVDAVQGYYFARPMSAEALINWLENQTR
jgi:diguanylate cyclase (GGDEF)-like protein